MAQTNCTVCSVKECSWRSLSLGLGHTDLPPCGSGGPYCSSWVQLVESASRVGKEAFRGMGRPHATAPHLPELPEPPEMRF